MLTGEDKDVLKEAWLSVAKEYDVGKRKDELTFKDFVELTGHGRNKARTILNAMIKDNKVTVRSVSNGRLNYYRLTKKEG